MIDIEQTLWGMNPEGEAIVLYTLRNERGEEVRLTNLGAAVVGLKTRDRSGKTDEVVLGFSSAEDYLKDTTALGACVGRTTGFVKLGKATLAGEEITLDRNHGRHHKDGGTRGFQHKLWESWVENDRLVMALESEEGDMGYPATLNAQLIFDFDAEGALEITYLAKSTAETPVSMAHNIVVNLAGADSGVALGHLLKINSSKVQEIDPMGIPSGALIDTADTALDFSVLKEIKEGIESPFNHIADLGGYTHTLAMEGWKQNILGEVAHLEDPRSGRTLDILSSYPAVYFSTENTLKGSCPAGRHGADYPDYGGILLRPQHFDDAVNHPELPTPIINRGELFCQKTVYRFGTQE